MTKTPGCEGKIVSRMHMIKNHPMIKIKSKLMSYKGIRKFSFSIQLNYREIFTRLPWLKILNSYLQEYIEEEEDLYLFRVAHSDASSTAINWGPDKN